MKNKNITQQSRKMVGIEKMEKKKVEEWKKNQVFNEIGSSEFVDLMVD